MLRGLDLFSGIGGLSVALRPYVRPIAYCEIDRYAQSVLLARQADGSIVQAPVWDDVADFPGADFVGAVDIVYGGFPCQDISVAGNGAGLGGKRSGLFFELLRVAEEAQAPFIFLENVAALRVRGAERVGKELAALGYDSRWLLRTAAEVGAPHERQRWFCLAAHPDRLGLRDVGKWRAQYQAEADRELSHPGPHWALADFDCQRLESGRSAYDIDWEKPPWNVLDRRDPAASDAAFARPQIRRKGLSAYDGWWATEPDVVRVVHGVSARLDRIAGLGNAVVPPQARSAFEELMGLKP